MSLSQIQNGLQTLVQAELQNSTGAFVHTGDYTINGTLTADTINVKTLVTEAGAPVELGSWSGNTEADIHGRGVSWTWGQGSTQLMYRNGNKLWTNAQLDLASGSNYSIDNTVVLSINSLGPTVQTSRLTRVGTLQSLAVSGDTNLGDFAFFNSTFNRMGIGNEEPNAAIDILENNVNITIGSPSTSLATIGTNSNHDLGLITDNITRLLIKSSGEITIGDEAGKNGVLRIHGSLFVDNLIADTRVDRTSPLQFQATRDSSIYGLGLVWSGTGNTRQLIMHSGPDRLWTTESIDIAAEKMYYINSQPVLSSTGLGDGVQTSNLTKLGVLSSLIVSGTTELSGNVTANNITTGSITLSNVGISSSGAVSIISQDSDILYGDNDVIEIGSKAGKRKPVKVFGPLSVGVNNPDPTLNFVVNGDVHIGQKRFTNGASAPASGSYELGDVCWNSNPTIHNYIGWVCVVAGNPGQWLPFGEIKSQ